MNNTVLAIVLILSGIFGLASSYFNWDWYYNNHRARLFVTIFGRTGARIFYAILGVGMIVFGIITVLQ
jgi:Immunity protein 17